MLYSIIYEYDLNSKNEFWVNIFLKSPSEFYLGGFTLRPTFEFKSPTSFEKFKANIKTIESNDSIFTFANIENNVISGIVTSDKLVSYSRLQDGSWLEIAKYQINYELNQISLKYHQEASRLLPKNHYIGFSITQGNVYRKKNWPIDNFILLAQKLKERNKIPVFFIEKDKIDLIKDIKSKIPEALFPELDSNLSCPALVTALASRLEKTISIDNGVMHMIGLSRTPMIVLFGPTNPDKFAPKIDNIKILDSKKIYSSKDITKITTNDILEFI